MDVIEAASAYIDVLQDGYEAERTYRLALEASYAPTIGDVNTCEHKTSKP